MICPPSANFHIFFNLGEESVTASVEEELPAEGVKDVAIVCPGFSSDCLETLEEIEVEAREIFTIAGGSKFHYIPALNSQPEHLDALTKIVSRHLD